ncbi:hypothetical protein Hanom_Chr05g00422591 [Helianthus anomalus]
MVACPAVACTGDYAFAASAWIEALLKGLEPTLQKAGGLACTGWRHCIVGRLMVVVAPRLMVVRSSLGQLALCNLYSDHCSPENHQSKMQPHISFFFQCKYYL